MLIATLQTKTIQRVLHPLPVRRELKKVRQFAQKRLVKLKLEKAQETIRMLTGQIAEPDKFRQNSIQYILYSVAAIGLEHARMSGAEIRDCTVEWISYGHQKTNLFVFL